MSTTRQTKISEDQNKVAQQLIDYILKSFNNIDDQKQHKADLLAIMDEVQIEYDKSSFNFLPLKLFEMLVHYFTRTRSDEIQDAREKIKGAQDQLTILEIIVNHLQRGGLEVTSSNSRLLDLLLAKLKSVEPLENDLNHEQIGVRAHDYQKTIRLLLIKAFVSNSKEKIDHYRKVVDATMKILVIEKPVQIKKLDLPDNFKIKLASVFDKDEKKAANPILSGTSILLLPKDGLTGAIIEDYDPDPRTRKAKLLKKFSSVVSVLETIYDKKKEVINAQEVVEDESAQEQHGNISQGKHAAAFALVEKMFAGRQQSMKPEPVKKVESVQSEAPLPPKLPSFFKSAVVSDGAVPPPPPMPKGWSNQGLFAVPAQAQAPVSEFDQEFERMARIEI